MQQEAISHTHKLFQKVHRYLATKKSTCWSKWYFKRTIFDDFLCSTSMNEYCIVSKFEIILHFFCKTFRKSSSGKTMKSVIISFQHFSNK